ncbi:rhodanese-like domain-containing protein [Bacteroidota bacterium]
MKHCCINQNLIILLFIISACQGCLSDEPGPSANFTINDTSELLVYLESKGDYINNTTTFSLIEAPEVFASLNDNLILDVRPSEEFAQGHIDGAINLTAGELLDYILERDHQSYSMIVIVSSSGQSSVYYTTLLRIYGLSNVYSMKWGMASWNPIFSSNWFNVINEQYNTTTFNNYIYEDKQYSPLPELNFDSENRDIESKLDQRVRFLLDRGFVEDPSWHVYSDASISLTELLERWDPNLQRYTDHYIVCMMLDLYFYEQSGWMTNPGHPPTTILYQALIPISEFRSNLLLQTIPRDETTIIYGYNGHFSAAFTAYFKILGYDVKSILFGYNRMHYGRMLEYDCFHEYLFGQDKIHNFPYTTE